MNTLLYEQMSLGALPSIPYQPCIHTLDASLSLRLYDGIFEEI
jgi:hypothetical protein